MKRLCAAIDTFRRVGENRRLFRRLRTQPPQGGREDHAADRDAIDAAIGRALEAWRDIAAGEMERAMTTLHTRPRDAAAGVVQ